MQVQLETYDAETCPVNSSNIFVLILLIHINGAEASEA